MILKLPGKEKGCACSDCEAACKIPEFPGECQDFVIVPVVDGVTFIMVVVFVLGSIIFIAIIFVHSVIKNSILKYDFFFQVTTRVVHALIVKRLVKSLNSPMNVKISSLFPVWTVSPLLWLSFLFWAASYSWPLSLVTVL